MSLFKEMCVNHILRKIAAFTEAYLYRIWIFGILSKDLVYW